MSTTIIPTWQSSQETLASKYGALQLPKETPNAMALVLNLQNIEVKSTLEKLGTLTPEEIKAVKALRTTFVIVKMLFPGWSFIDTEADAKDNKFAKNKASKGGGGGKEKLGYLDGENAILHCYRAENKKGVYSKSKRLDECVALSPGMVVGAMIWGDKIVQTFKDHKEDFRPFQLGIVQLYIKSNMASTASDAGRMLEIKGFYAVNADASISSFKLLREGVLANSVQAAAVLRERILDGSLVSDQYKRHLNQSLIQGSYSNGIQVLSLTPQPSNGVISLAADGKIKMFVHEPIGDVKAHAINLEFDRKAHCSENDEWTAKLFNVGLMLGAVQIIVIMDSYKTKDVPEAELVYEGYIRMDISAVIKSIIACPKSEILSQSPSEMESKKQPILALFEAQGMLNAAKHLLLFPSISTTVANLDIVIDTRKVINKRDITDEAPTTTIVHHEAKWKEGHFAHFFFDGKSTLSAVIQTVESGGSAMFMDRAKRGLDSSLQFADMMKDVEFVAEPEPTQEASASAENDSEGSASKPNNKKKQKTAANQ
jgi:hypothetical protein